MTHPPLPLDDLEAKARAATPGLEKYVGRFLSRVVADGDCLIWTGSTSGKPGRMYGCFWIGKPIKAHQFAHLAWRGPLDPALMVCHHCDRPLCVNPAHLYLGTASDNVRDAVVRGRHSNGQAEKTHCPLGHPYVATNTYRYRGDRQCRICRDIHRGRPISDERMAKLIGG